MEVLEDGVHGVVLGGLVDLIHDQQTHGAQVSHSLLQQRQVQAGGEEQDLRGLEL